MTSLRRFFFTGVSALVVATTLLLAPGCKPKPHPEAFTAKLTEIEGVQSVYTLRHPKLIFGDLDKLINAVPEAAMARMFFGQLTAYGYPEFSEIEAGSNIGIAMLALNPDALDSAQPEFVGFAKLKEGGKIWTALTQSGLVLEKHGAWTWIAQNASLFAKVKAPDALLVYIERPQTEELRAWGRVSPALLAKAKEFLLPKLQAKLTKRPPEEQKALLAYFDIAWGYLAQLHSIGGSLDLNDEGITLTYSAQFLPDSPTGTWLRYAPGPAPKIAQSLPADGLFSIVARQNMPGQIEFVGGLLDALIAVNYPAGNEYLKAAKASYLNLASQSDGGIVANMNMSLPVGGQPPVLDMLGVYSGRFKEAQVAAFYKDTFALSQKGTTQALAAVSALSPGTPLPEIHQELKENVLMVDGVSFGSIVTTSKITAGGHEQTTKTTQYYGVVGGNLVYATSEAALRAKLPAIAAGLAVPDAAQPALKGDDVAVMALQGGKLVDTVAASVQIDLADADIQAQLKSFKDGYAASGPIKVSLAASQAQGTLTVSIPYKFIAESVRLGQFAGAYKAKTAPSAGATTTTPAPAE